MSPKPTKHSDSWKDVVDVINLDKDTTSDTSLSYGDLQSSTEDAPIVTEAVEIIKGNVYRPNKTAKAVLDRAVQASEMSVNDILNMAMMLLQDASPIEVERAMNAILRDKSRSLFDSLK